MKGICMAILSAIKRLGLMALAAILLAGSFLCGGVRANEVGEGEALHSIECGEADRIIVERALRLAFLGSPDGSASWTPRYSFNACNSEKKYTVGVPENSMPYSRSALFNESEFRGMQQYIGWVDPDSGATPTYAYTITNFLRLANRANSIFDLAAKAATAQGAKWGALLGSDCSAFLSYAWQVPHMTTYMFTSDAVDWNICRVVPETRGHESRYTYEDILALLPGDAMIAAHRSGTDENGNPLYRGHCVIITDIKLNSDGVPVTVETVEEIAPRAAAKSRSVDDFLAYANKLHSSGGYFVFYRLISKRHLKLEIELTYDTAGGNALSDEESCAAVFARFADGSLGVYGGALSPVPERAGFVFLGWGLEPGGSDILEAATPITVMRDHTLYARWRTE
jgi:hypothetical protein